ncbi:MAG: phage antirepressor protein, partial [Clostridia bacterium]|nr:phage antirepressor protein [Clostridia bacterium]
AETATKEFSQAEQPSGFEQNRAISQRGGQVAGDARRAIEQGTGKPVITNKNAAQLNHVVAQMIETSASASEALPREVKDNSGNENA